MHPKRLSQSDVEHCVRFGPSPAEVWNCDTVEAGRRLKEAGFTPTAVDFTYYATREVRLVKPGFETQTFKVPLASPWYQLPPLDFFSDNLSPGSVSDRREMRFTLQPQVVVPQNELIDRANSLRNEARIGN